MNVDSDTLSNGPKWLFYFVEKKLLALAHDGSLCSLSQWLDSSSLKAFWRRLIKWATVRVPDVLWDKFAGISNLKTPPKAKETTFWYN